MKYFISNATNKTLFNTIQTNFLALKLYFVGLCKVKPIYNIYRKIQSQYDILSYRDKCTPKRSNIFTKLKTHIVRTIEYLTTDLPQLWFDI